MPRYVDRKTGQEYWRNPNDMKWATTGVPKFEFIRIYNSDNKAIGGIFFDEVEEFNDEESFTISWAEDGVMKLYRKRE